MLLLSLYLYLSQMIVHTLLSDCKLLPIFFFLENLIWTVPEFETYIHLYIYLYLHFLSLGGTEGEVQLVGEAGAVAEEMARDMSRIGA